jgi:hypothetical protein
VTKAIFPEDFWERRMSERRAEEQRIQAALDELRVRSAPEWKQETVQVQKRPQE